MSARGGCKERQRGAALIVVLSLLTIATMLGLSSMQSSLVDERMAGNYRAASQAQMNAEKGAAEFFHWLQDQGEWPDAPGEKTGWESEVSNSGYSIDNNEDDWDNVNKEVVITVRGMDGGGANAYLEAKFSFNPLAGGRADAAFSCFGSNCSYSVGAGAANSPNHVGASGYDHLAAGQCSSIRGANQPGRNNNGEDRAGVIMPDGAISSQGGPPDGVPGGGPSGSDGEDDGSPSGVEGDPAFIESDSDYLSTDYYAEGGLDSGGSEPHGLRQVYLDYYEGIMGEIESGGASSGAVSGGPAIAYAGAGQTITISGDASGIVVLEGGSLTMQGDSCFVGLVIAMPGKDEQGQEVHPSFVGQGGVPAIIGAIWGEEFTMSGNGVPSIYYSSEAMGFDDLFKSRGGFVVIDEWESCAIGFFLVCEV